MTPESTEKMQHIYRLQQSKLVSISNLTENLSNICVNLENFSSEQKGLAGELENCTNKIRSTIIRLGRKSGVVESFDNEDDGLLSPSRKKSLLHTLQEIHDTSSSVAEKMYTLSMRHKYSAELVDLSAIMVKHFLWRERVFMAIILGGHDNENLKIVSARTCTLGKWYDGKGKQRYAHLPAYLSLGEVHTSYHNVINELIDQGIEKITFNELSSVLAKVEMLSQRLVGLIGQIQHHVSLLQSA
ncbi:chemotaxis protein [Salmonella enterica]|uniref:Chemotaxis protein n=1 Tax=Salmonella newport TaxID=108619 RepID=A0A5U9VTP2_SALNE|nr:chemotaxis protein [Salmonella enterica subsp. enterica serovar Newport]ECB3301585.1 chemotaxis protein [Salmonella enterica subsp. enterica serovar Newport]EHI3120783.1 chemotaxis protein [Salmonella enterica]